MQEAKICPYPGLRPFNEEESIFFRGREEHIKKIISQLEQRKFLMLTGASGDGKSSIVYAGVIPNARAGFFKANFNNWIIADFRPERSPLKNMAIALSKKLGYTDVNYVEKELRFGFSSLVDLYKKSPFYLDYNSEVWKNSPEIEQKKLKRKAANIFILVDQFEEFFTNSENYNNGKPSVNSQVVINLLLETAKIAIAENLPIYIICTMRSDYVGQCAAFRGLPEYIGFSQFFVPRLKRKEVHQVIDEPAMLSGNKISNRLIETLINECDGHDQLPILQHALNRIWKAHMVDSALEMDIIHYAKVGGMDGKLLPVDQKILFLKWHKNQPEFKQQFWEGASLTNVLNAHARELFETSVDYCQKYIDRTISREEAHKILQKIFTCLTKINDSRAVRNRATVLEIKQIIGEEVTNSLIEGLINLFREPDNNLVQPFISDDRKNSKLNDTDILDITHESLIRNWTELTEWTKQDHENVSIINDLKKQVERWEQKNRSKDYLLTIGSLSYFKNWYKIINPNPYLLVKYDSSNVSPKQKLQEAIQLIKPADEFLRISESTLKQKRRAVVVLASIVAIVLLGFTSWAFRERNKALQKTEEAKRSEYNAKKAERAANSAKEGAIIGQKYAMKASREAELSKLEALSAKGRAEKSTIEARENLIQAKQNADLAKSETEKANKALIESEKAKQEAILSQNKSEKAEKKSSQMSNLSLAQSVALKSDLLSADPQLQTLLAYQAYKFTLDNGGETQDHLIYSAIRNSYFNLNKDAAVPKMLAPTEQRTLKIMPDNTILLSADKAGNIYKWDFKSEKQLEQGKLNFPVAFETVSFTDLENILISGHEEGNVCIWDIKTIKTPILIKEVKEHNGPIRIITFNTHTKLLVTAGKDSCICVWNYSNSGIELLKKIRLNYFVQDIAILPDGTELAVALTNGNLIVINVASQKITTVSKNEKSKVWSLKVNEEKKLLAIGYTDGKVQLFDTQKKLTQENTLFTFSESNTTIEKMEFSTTNEMFAIASADKSIKIFNLAKKAQKPVEIKDIKSKTRCLVFSSENILFASGADHSIRKIEPSSEKMVSSFCEQLKRNLTPNEWEQYIGETVPYEKTCKSK